MENELNTGRKKPGPKPKNTIDRGRTGADLPPAMLETQQGLVSGSREEAAHSSGRAPRISMGNVKKLEIPPSLLEAGYYYRWFQNKEGRIAAAKAAYYEQVVDEQGNSFTRQSGPYSMHLMRLPQQYRDEDNALKRKRVAATLDQEASIGVNEYAPDSQGRAEGGQSAITHHTSNAL